MKTRDNKLDASEIVSEEETGLKVTKKYPMSNYMIAATLMQFFMDGYDSLSSVITMSLYYLATNPAVMEEAIREVDEIADKYGENLTGEQATELKYLDMVGQETIRSVPFPVTQRTCNKAWKIPGTDAVLPVSARALIPIAGINMDPEFFPEPEKFIPERFSPENKGTMAKAQVMTFGMGPRACIGMKIARLELKLFLFKLLRRFTLETCEKTSIPIKWDFNAFARIEGGCYLKAVKRNH